MNRAIVPIANLSRRIPEAGRIRTGVKAGKAMRALPHFRFTSHDEEALGQIAAMYGGTVKPWSDPKAAAGQFEVITEAAEIRVVLPPDPLGGTPVYELWGGGGCERRCDGLTAQVLQRGEDGLEQVDVPCMCDAAGEMSCRVITRLSVILPEVRFAGVWRLDTKSWNAAQELPGMVDMVQTMQGQGLAYATLALKHRRSVQAGKTNKFITPMLGIPASIEQLAAGGSRLTSITAGEHLAETAGELGPGSPDDPDDGDAGEPAATESAPGDDAEVADGEIVDAEIVHDDAQVVAQPELTGDGHRTGSVCSVCGEPYGDGALVRGRQGESRYVHTACRATDEPMAEGLSKRIHAELRKRQIVGPERHDWATVVLGREITTFSELTAADGDRLAAWLDEHPEPAEVGS